jgi:hypothetical protein
MGRAVSPCGPVTTEHEHGRPATFGLPETGGRRESCPAQWHIGPACAVVSVGRTGLGAVHVGDRAERPDRRRQDPKEGRRGNRAAEAHQELEASSSTPATHAVEGRRARRRVAGPVSSAEPTITGPTPNRLAIGTASMAPVNTPMPPRPRASSMCRWRRRSSGGAGCPGRTAGPPQFQLGDWCASHRPRPCAPA